METVTSFDRTPYSATPMFCTRLQFEHSVVSRAWAARIWSSESLLARFMRFGTGFWCPGDASGTWTNDPVSNRWARLRNSQRHRFPRVFLMTSHRYNAERLGVRNEFYTYNRRAKLEYARVQLYRRVQKSLGETYKMSKTTRWHWLVTTFYSAVHCLVGARRQTI